METALLLFVLSMILGVIWNYMKELKLSWTNNWFYALSVIIGALSLSLGIAALAVAVAASGGIV